MLHESHVFSLFLIPLFDISETNKKDFIVACGDLNMNVKNTNIKINKY